MKFVNCFIEGCKFVRDNVKDGEFSNIIIKNRELKIDKNLIIHNCHLFNCELSGIYDYIEFFPRYCKNVKILDDFLFHDGKITLNCLVWGGLELGKNINKFIASLVLVNKDFVFIDKDEILMHKLILEKYFKEVEECQQKAKSKKD
ncbi:MAG: hypothetical protein QW746_04505 [Thermoplasmata archaeon]